MPRTNYGIQEQSLFNLIGKVKKYGTNRLQYKHTANSSSLMRPKQNMQYKYRYQNYILKNVSFGILYSFHSAQVFIGTTQNVFLKQIYENQLIISLKLAIFPNANGILEWLNLHCTNPDVTTTTFQERFLSTP